MNNNIEKVVNGKICYVKEYNKAFYHLLSENALLKTSESFIELRWRLKKVKERMRELVQIVEMVSWVNYGFAKQNMGREPNCEEASMYYVAHGGAEKFAAKWPQMWQDINSSFNKGDTLKEVCHKPDFVERYVHWLIYNGLDNFYKRHPEYLLCEVVRSPIAVK